MKTRGKVGSERVCMVKGDGGRVRRRESVRGDYGEWCGVRGMREDGVG